MRPAARVPQCKVISDSQITEELAPYGVRANDQLCRRIQDYIQLLLLWNRRVSLTTVVEPKEIIRFHFGESLFAVEKAAIENGRLADVGSGAGFPGLPIAMTVPGLGVTLIEANQKKAAFLSEVIRRLDLRNTMVLRARLSEVTEELGAFDFITARAVGPHSELIRWSFRFLKPSGRLILWLGEDDATLIRREDGWDWQTMVRIPGSQRRVLLVGSRRNRSS